MKEKKKKKKEEEGNTLCSKCYIALCLSRQCKQYLVSTMHAIEMLYTFFQEIICDYYTSILFVYHNNSKSTLLKITVVLRYLFRAFISELLPFVYIFFYV